MGPALLWASIVWRAHTCARFGQLYDLPFLRRLTAPAIQSPPKSWKSVRGPLGATVWSLVRIGWMWLSPFEYRTDQGEIVTLTSTSPKLLQCKVAAAWQRKLTSYAAEQLGLPKGIHLDATVGISLMKTLPHPYSTMVGSYLVKPVWTNNRLAKCGYDVSPLCELCGQATDTLNHRLFKCAHSAPLRSEL